VRKPAAARSGIGLVAVTAAGRAGAAELEAAWPEARRYPGPAREALAAAFTECGGIVVFLAVGATVRLLAPLLTDKHDDPVWSASMRRGGSRSRWSAGTPAGRTNSPGGSPPHSAPSRW
jgi:hypothetical protein